MRWTEAGREMAWWRQTVRAEREFASSVAVNVGRGRTARGSTKSYDRRDSHFCLPWLLKPAICPRSRIFLDYRHSSIGGTREAEFAGGASSYRAEDATGFDRSAAEHAGHSMGRSARCDRAALP